MNTASSERLQKMPLRAVREFARDRGLYADLQPILSVRWPAGSRFQSNGPLRRGFAIEFLRNKGVFDEFKQQRWPYGNSPGGVKYENYCLRLRQQYEHQAGEGPLVPPDQTSAEEDFEEDREFAKEDDLRDFLAKNPSCIEPGLTLYSDGGRTGIEFAIDGGFIDILAVDRDSRLVVIELKVGRGRNKAIGQLLYYMGWVDRNMGRGRCRGMIIAKEIPNDLTLAVQRATDVSLHVYRLSVSVERTFPTVTDTKE